MSDVEVDNNGRSAPGAPATPEFAIAGQSSYARTLFVGPDGLRPGWGFAFYAISFFLLQQVAVQLAWMRNLGDGGLWSMLLEELGDLVAAVVPALVLARVEGRLWSAYGLPAQRAFGRQFWTGAVWGFAAISLLVFSLYVMLHGIRALRFAAFWALMFLLVGFFEEFLLRGYSQFTLARGIGFWRAAFGLSSAFGLIHLRNGGEHWPGLLAAGFIGLFLCLTLRRTGSLWFAVGFHAAWDWGETFFYSVPDSGSVFPGHLLSSSLRGPDWLSGGSVGPEGSVLCFLVMAVTWIAFERTHRRSLDSSALDLPSSGADQRE